MKHAGHRIKILYLNSSNDFSKVVLHNLKGTDYEFDVQRIHTVDDFKVRLSSSSPEIILADLHPSTAHIAEALRFINESRMNMPFMLMTEGGTEASAQDLMKSGVSDYVFIDRPNRLPAAIIKTIERERLLHQTVEQFDRSSREFSDLVKNIPFGIAIFNSGKKLNYFNKALLQLCYGTYANLESSSFEKTTLDLYDGSNESILLETDIINSCLCTGKTLIKDDLYILRADGSKRYVSLAAIPMRNSKGNIHSVAVLFIDITEQKSANLHAKALAELIQFKNTELSQFAYLISHNLRDPIAKILGLTSIWDPISEDTAFILSKVNEEANNLDTIVKDLNVILSLRNAEKERKEQISFDHQLSLVSQVLQKEILESKAEISIDFTKAPEIYTVKSYLYSVLFNLLSNSIKYRDPGRPLKIEIKTTTSDEYLCLTVKDNGRGIDTKKHKDKIFGLYRRFHLEGIPGKGVGLHFVKKYAEALGGRAEIRSNVNEGTEVKIFFLKIYENEQRKANYSY